MSRTYLLYSIRPNYFPSVLYYGRRQECHTSGNSSVVESEFVGLHACVSTWDYYCSVYHIPSIKRYCAEWVLIFPIGCHCKCVCRHCASAASRNLCVGETFSHIFEIADSVLPIHRATCTAVVFRINWVIPQKCVAVCSRPHAVRAHNHVSLEWDGKSATTTVVGDHDFLTFWRFGSI